MSEDQPTKSAESLCNTNLEDSDIIDLDEAVIEISERYDRLIEKNRARYTQFLYGSALTSGNSDILQDVWAKLFQ